MKYKIKAKCAVQLISIGQTLPSGAEIEWEGDKLPVELENARRQGLILYEKVEVETAKEPVKPAPTPKPKKVELPEVKEEVKEDKTEEKPNDEKDDEDEDVDFPSPSKPLDKMSKDELKDYAKEIDMDPGTLTKADLLKAIEKWIE